MIGSEVEVLSRAHRLFFGATEPVSVESVATPARPAELDAGGSLAHYRRVLQRGRAVLLQATRIDAAAAHIFTAAHHDHVVAREETGRVVDEARADTAGSADTPLAQRELMRRRAGRIRAQRSHLLTARQRALRHRHALRSLRYPATRRGVRLPRPTGRAALAVRAALSRLGRPYVWGGCGPRQFDCSGLTQWSYAQAGVHLDRTTYQQIHQGIPVPRGYVRPGDLVFPNPGHVQLAIGNNMVVEAPHPGAAVRISPLGAHVQIRRPI